MEIIIFLLFGFPILVALAIIIGIAVVRTQSSAKRQAAQMVESGKITKDFDRVSKILAAMTNDLEAVALWQKLQELKH
ncbi:hypothetical protein LCGC14_0535360 [marine sediment metagenome]|uniref:Uncharacterized protein n=1 Tax=marine sediment metagenome TaxID=412755 RepID=A0A0F9SCP2_9ZZZZ